MTLTNRETHIYKIPRVFMLIVMTIIMMMHHVNAQELNCRVEVNSQQIEGVSRQVFQTLQEAINDYMNTTVFTNAQFAPNEKIDCQMFFTIKEYTDGIMKGDLQVQSTRPVYNSAYTTPILNFRDTKLDFAYQEGEPLVYSLNNMESQLTAILNYYAFLILAMDFDTFSLKGGEPFYDRLRQIVQMGQSSGEAGWKAFEDTNNRSAVLSALTDPQTSGYRNMLYEYHRKGLDDMALNPDKGRATIHSTIHYIADIQKVAPMSVALSMFRDSKLDELVNVYSKGTADERKEAYEMLERVYPSDNQRLLKIKNGQQK